MHIYECKWTIDKIGESIMSDLQRKGQELSATNYGTFSKAGFKDEIQNKEYDLITVDDLFSK
jgi:hypothetical protein